MSDDGGICWFQTVAEEQEYLEWLDKIESDKAIAQPVNARDEKETENVGIDDVAAVISPGTNEAYGAG